MSKVIVGRLRAKESDVSRRGSAVGCEVWPWRHLGGSVAKQPARPELPVSEAARALLDGRWHAIGTQQGRVGVEGRVETLKRVANGRHTQRRRRLSSSGARSTSVPPLPRQLLRRLLRGLLPGRVGGRERTRQERWQRRQACIHRVGASGSVTERVPCTTRRAALGLVVGEVPGEHQFGRF